jgi:hypothetical protein
MPDITFQAIDGSKQKGLPDMSSPRQISRAAVAVAFAIASLNGAALQAPADFVTTVTSTHPLAYYRLDGPSGKSQVGTTTWKSTGGVTAAAPGAPIGASVSKFAKFDGHDGAITTTQSGGIGTAATIMAWVNLAALPSKVGRIFYVAGESQSGNDFDLQFEPDNAIRFFTAGGGNLTYQPPVATLVDQWHLVVASVDTVSLARVIYWDGKRVATDKGGGRAGKTSAFTIGESPVFTGRFFKGGIQEVALWSRALKAAEVAAIYASSNAVASAVAPSAAPANSTAPTPTTGPFATTAKIDIEDAKGPVQLRREEQIAYMFLSAIEIIEHECQLTIQHTCPLDQILSGSYPKGAIIEHLKFDPSKTDPNYTYTLATNGMAWEAHANPRKPGLKGFCSMARDVGTVVVTYSNAGPAGWTSTELGNRGTEGDSFATQ